jgi:hypothetical protein
VAFRQPGDINEEARMTGEHAKKQPEPAKPEPVLEEDDEFEEFEVESECSGASFLCSLMAPLALASNKDPVNCFIRWCSLPLKALLSSTLLHCRLDGER